MSQTKLLTTSYRYVGMCLFELRDDEKLCIRERSGGIMHSIQSNLFLLSLPQLIHKMGSSVHIVKWLPCGYYL